MPAPPTKISILTVSAALHLVGHPIASVLEEQWSSSSSSSLSSSSSSSSAAAAAAKQAGGGRFFDNVGFDLDPANPAATLAALRAALRGRRWDGVLVGWCVRGHAELTGLFEGVVAACVDEVARRRAAAAAATTKGDSSRGGEGEEEEEMGDKGPKLLFCTGADDVVGATLRAFPP